MHQQLHHGSDGILEPLAGLVRIELGQGGGERVGAASRAAICAGCCRSQ
jgi:hypothetical protein